MALAIGQIKLSSGTIVNLPIFPYPQSDWSEVARVGGVLSVYEVNNSGGGTSVQHVAGLSDDDLLEFYSLITNHEYNGFTPGTFSTDGHYMSVMMAYWFEKSNGDFVFQYTSHYAGSSNHNITKSNGNVIYIDTVDLPSITNVLHNASYNDVGVAGNGSTTYPYILTTFAGMKLDAEARQGINRVANVTPNGITFYYQRLSTGTSSLLNWLSDVSTSYNYQQIYDNITNYANANDLDVGINTYDSDNPYAYQEASFGGGDGSMLMFDPDGVDPAEVPALPTLSASNIGFMSVYNPSASNLRALSQFLWSSAFDIDSFKKLFSDPMQCIIGLGIVPVRPTIGGSKNVTFGDIDSGISMSYISSEFVEKDMGFVSIDKLYGSFMDYNQTSIQIYLPYIGFRQLQPDDIIGGSIGVVYHINVIDGGCTAYIRHSSRGVLYQYSGSCIANIPLSAINYSGAIQNAVTAAINGGAVIAGIATGAAPVSAMGAAGLVSNAANLAINSKPQVQRSGSVSGSAGLMGIQRPYIIIERANISVPADMEKFVGNTTNVTMSLNSCSGFTIIDHIRMQDFSCTNDEKTELESILHKGVIF